MIVTTRHSKLPLAAALAAAMLFVAGVPARAHQAVNPKILKLVAKAPAGTPSCYDGNGVPTAACIEKGRKLFETGTFGGNGRTCASCHPATNNFTLDVPFISKLPAADKLFVNEQVPALKELETPLLRKYGLVCENLDGFANDANGKQSCVMRSVIATEGLAASTGPDGTGFDSVPTGNGFKPARPLFPLKGALGWSGDGSPGNGSLRNFAIGAVVQHFPKTLLRSPGIDFVLPSEDQLDALEAFQLSLGRKKDLNLNPDPSAQNKSFNCTVYEAGVTDCATNPVFQLKKLSELQPRQGGFTGPLITFNDDTVTNGQLLFFGGIPSKPVNGVATNIRTCSGCHIQAGAGSASAVNTPQPAGNRQRATGASMSPNAPACLTEAQGVIYNADGGFGAGADGFPQAQDGTTVPCSQTQYTSAFVPSGSCFKTFDTSTQPPLSNAALSGSAQADVGTRNSLNRRDICGGSAPDELVYMTGTGFFSTPSAIEAASTIPLFHNNIAATVEDSVSFYSTAAFDRSASGNGNRMFLADVTDEDSHPVNIVNSVGAFLRAVNAFNNLRISVDYIDAATAAIQSGSNSDKVRNAKLAFLRASDAVGVLTAGGPATKNYLGGPADLFTGAPAVLSSIQAAKNKLTLYGSTDSGYGKLALADLKSARNQIATACQAMVSAEALSECPAIIP